MSARKILPANITSYDLLKCMAVINMFIDHIGYYFFPENEWWRASVFPVWFFFIGHASGRSISTLLWGGALVLCAANVVVGMPLLPLNNLITIILIRLALDPIMSYAEKGVSELWQVITFMILLAIPVSLVLEYGTIGFIYAIFGYAVRHRQTFLPGHNVLFPIMLASLFSFVVYQQLIFGFTPPAFLLMAMGTLGTCFLMLYFRPMEFSGLSARIPAIFKAPIQFMGRRTLEIYISHLLLFKVMAAILNPVTYPLFQFRLFL